MEDRLERQQGVIARWQLLEDGLTEREADHLASRWRNVHRAVYVTGHAPLSDWQRWFAATLTESGTALARWSAAAYLGLRTATDDEPAHVVRSGSGGHRRYARTKNRLDALWVTYSETLGDDLVERDGISSTSAARCVLDLCCVMSAQQRDRLFRDAIRTGVTDRQQLRDVMRQHRGERGTRRLRELLSRYEEIPIERAKSDPEIEGLVVLRDAGERLPHVDVAGFVADFVDFERLVITELDGPQYHQFPIRDRERNDAWKAAGFEVRRLSTDAPYELPDSVVRAARAEQDVKPRRAA